MDKTFLICLLFPLQPRSDGPRSLYFIYREHPYAEGLLTAGPGWPIGPCGPIGPGGPWQETKTCLQRNGQKVEINRRKPTRNEALKPHRRLAGSG